MFTIIIVNGVNDNDNDVEDDHNYNDSQDGD